MFRLIRALHPPWLCLSIVTVLGLFLNPLFYVLSVIFLGDLIARYRDYRFISNLEQPSPAVIKRYSKSWCQRVLINTVFPETKAIYYAKGYRWYRLIPDGFISRRSPLFRLKWYKVLFCGTEEARKL